MHLKGFQGVAEDLKGLQKSQELFREFQSISGVPEGIMGSQWRFRVSGRFKCTQEYLRRSQGVSKAFQGSQGVIGRYLEVSVVLQEFSWGFILLKRS